MSRYTSKDYINDLKDINRRLAFECCISFPVYGGRYDMTYADENRIYEDGLLKSHNMIDCGSPKVALAAAYEFAFKQESPKTLTRQQCKSIAFIAGIDFELDYHQLHSEYVELLVDLSKKSKYKKPTNANGSIARYFYAHLQSRVKVNLSNYGFGTSGLK
jgi:hypothetical protein